MLNRLRTEKWIQKLNKTNNEIYIVGGFVRDMLLGVKSNDIDILLTSWEYNDIFDVLKNFGKFTETNTATKTIKFRPNNWDNNLDDIDIVIPREDIAMTDEEFDVAKLSNPKLNRHHAFNIVSNPNMSVEYDLQRRDIRINSIALNLMTNVFVDPFNGISDLKNGIVKVTNKRTFIDDPVRMIRVLRFACRFGFQIEDTTFNLIKENASLIKGMSKERFLIELNKLFKAKNNLMMFVDLLIKSGLQKELFNTTEQVQTNNNINLFEDFLFIVLGKQVDSSKSSRQYLKCENDSVSILNNIQLAVNFNSIDNVEVRQFIFKLNKNSLDSGLFNTKLKDQIHILKTVKFLSTKDLAINGNEIIDICNLDKTNKNDLIKIGLFQKKMVNFVLENIWRNNKKQLTEFLKTL